MVGWSYVWGISGGEWQSTGLKEHLDYYRPENTTSVFGPNTNAYFPKMYMSKDMNQRYKPVTYKTVPMPV